MIQQDTALQAWKDALEHIAQHGHSYKDVRQRLCIETTNMITTINNPNKQITHPIEYLQHIGDWIYPSPQEIASATLGHQSTEAYGYSYSSRLFHFNEKNQINDYIIPLLKKDANSRRAIITLLDPKQDQKFTKHHIPGIVNLYFRIQEQKLCISAYIRSNDMFIGWPANIYQVFVLQEYVAARLDREIGSLTIISASAHIFQEHMPYIKKLLKH